jgi:hypothetical protein
MPADKPGLTPKGTPMPQTVEEWKYLYSLAEEKMYEMAKENSILRSQNHELRQKLFKRKGIPT